MRYIVDRIEDGIAVLECEDGSHRYIKADVLPDKAKDGSALLLIDKVYILDEVYEAERRKRITDIKNRLKAKKLV